MQRDVHEVEVGARSAADRCAAAWVRELDAFASAGAHGLRNVLNAGLTNLEVVRTRSVRGLAGDAIAPYAESASSGIEQGAARTEALLALARDGRGPADIVATLQLLAAFLGPSAAPAVRIPEGGSAARWTTTIPTSLARALLARAVRTAARVGGTITCEAARHDGILVRVEVGDAAGRREAEGEVAGEEDPLSMLAAEHGVDVTSTNGGFEITFPALAT